jgi:hypothetical protein
MWPKGIGIPQSCCVKALMLSVAVAAHTKLASMQAMDDDPSNRLTHGAVPYD